MYKPCIDSQNQTFDTLLFFAHSDGILLVTLFSEAPRHGSPEAQRHAHDTLHMSSHAAHTAMTGANATIATVTTPASLADAQEAIPGLPDHLVATHILNSEYFDDPADLARLPAVSRGMRDAVAETGLRFEELDEKRAAELGCLSALYRRQRGGRLSRRERLCEAEARVGNLEVL